MLRTILDPDGTHDILFAQRIDSRIPGLIAGKLGNHSPFEAGVGFPIALVERTGPGLTGDEDQWAEYWTDLYFETLLKPLSRTFILTDGYLNGSAYGFEPEYFAEIAQDTFDSVFGDREWPEEIKISVPAGETALVTWIEKAHPEVKSAPFCDKLTNRISVWMRRQVVLTAKNEALEWIMPARNADFMLHNSLVVVNGAVVTTPTNGADLVRFQRLQATCYLILNGLDLPEQCKVLTGCTAKLTALINYQEQEITLNGVFDSAFPLRLDTSSEPGQIVTYNSPIFSSVPQWWHNASLNTVEELDPNLIVSGESSLSISKNYFVHRLSYWNKNPVGELYSLNDLLSIDYGGLGYEGMPQCTLKTSTKPYILGGDIDLEIVQNRSFFCSPYPISLGESKNYLVSDLVPFADVVSEPYYYESFSSVQRLSTYGNKDGIFASHFHQYATNEDVPNVYGDVFIQGKDHLRQTFSYYNKLDQVSLSHEDDLSLFKSGQVAYIKNHIAIRNEWFWEIVGRTTLYTGTYSYTFEGVLYNDRHAVVITYDATNPLIVSATKANTIDDNSIGLSNSKSYASSSSVWSPTDRLNAFLVETEVPLTRTMRSTSLSTNYYELLKTADFIPTDSKLESILYPEGPDGAPFLDPDTDNGDIMPDSERIKEIHAALDAARFANHSQSTEENPKTQLRTLGRLIEAASYVLGVNFDEDGKNIAYPEPVLFDPEKIAEINEKKLLKNAQFAIAEINGGFDASSLYEVRSALLKKDRKEEYVDTRPHAVKVHNLQQAMDALADDISRQLGGSTSAAFQVPSVNGIQVGSYAGITQAIADCLYMLSAHSANIDELQTQSLKTVWMLQQILKGLGLPYHVAELPVTSGFADDKGEYLEGVVPVPEIDAKSPTLTSLLGIVLLNLQRMVGTTVSFREETDTSEA